MKTIAKLAGGVLSVSVICAQLLLAMVAGSTGPIPAATVAAVRLCGWCAGGSLVVLCAAGLILLCRRVRTGPQIRYGVMSSEEICARLGGKKQ